MKGRNTKRLVAEHGSFRAKLAKRIPRMTSVLARKKQQAMVDRRFGKKFGRKNNDNHAVNVERFGARQENASGSRAYQKNRRKIFRPRLTAAFA